MFAFTALQPQTSRAITNGETGDAVANLADVHQSLLSIAPNIKILIDVGWDADLSVNLDYLSRIASSVDAVLLTHATIESLGAYCYLCKMNPTFASVPTYATLPVVNMGRIITLDSYRQRGLLGPLNDTYLSISDVESTFDKIQPLKYSQPVSLSGKLQGITITAFNSGHTLGGTIWKIQKDQEIVVYSVDWNHSRDQHLNGAFIQPNSQILESLQRPSVMICGTKTGDPSLSLKKKKDTLFKSIQECLDRGGTVLMPTSTGARDLELCYMLDSYWESKRLKFPLIYYSHVGTRTLSYASSMIEWMSSNLIDEWQVKNNSPFDSRSLKVLSDVNLLAGMDGPKLIMASGEAMENSGFARTVFARLCDQSSTTVILTEVPAPGTLGHSLYELWQSSKADSTVPCQLTTKMHLSFFEEEPLQGEELTKFTDFVSEQRQKEEVQNVMDLRNKNILEQDENESSEDEDEEDEENFMIGQLDMRILIYGTDVHDIDVRKLKGRARNLPSISKRRRVDDYGEVIKLEDFMKTNEEKLETYEDKAEQADENEVGKKRKWVDEIYHDETSKLDYLSPLAVPKKIVSKEEEIKVLCNLLYLDFQGLTDERSINMIVPSVQPKQLILLPSASSIERDGNSLVQSLEKTFGTDNVYWASPNEVITTAISNTTFSVKVSSELERFLTWQKTLGDYNVAHVTGRLEVRRASQNKLLEAPGADDGNAVKNEVNDVEMQLVEANANSEHLETEILLIPLRTAAEFAQALRSNPLLVGDIKLAELKKKLIAKGHRAEFRAEGILVCDDKVAIRKIAEGRLVIEGGIGNEFYETKNMVRSLLARV
jgi:cleavage and polyadenylation specificity factor subunit 2